MHSVSYASHHPIRRGSDKTLLDVEDLENAVQHSKTAINVVVQPKKERENPIDTAINVVVQPKTERENPIDSLEDIAFDK